MSQHVMIDLETLGTRTDSVIVSIGAVLFDEREIHDRFYQRIDIQSALDAGLTVSGDTIAWWMRQGDEARAMFNEPGAPLAHALKALSVWLPGRALIWGNGADFDNALLAYAYSACKLPIPWLFWNNRCFRTVKNAYPKIIIERTGVYHNALDDAEHQANHLLSIFNQFGPMS